ncbi:MAG TPA: hypothetical protein VMS16_02765 [Mycobacterium sp.]|nr:hypothetical protein [Mycobacterium sp.]
MTLKKMAGICATVGALSFSMIGLAGVANAAALPHAVPSVVQHAQLAGWGGPGGWHGPGPGGPGGHGPGPGGLGWRGPGWGGPGWGRPGWRGPGPGFPGWGFPPPPCPLGLCI